MNRTFKTIVTLTAVLLTSTLLATHLSKEKINERTAPVAQVTTAEMAKKVADAAKAAAPVRTGESTYGSLCISCHGTGLANAPKAGDTEAWSKLLERGIDDLVASAKKGKNVMPPKGTCADCSDEDLKNAIEYMSTAKN